MTNATFLLAFNMSIGLSFAIAFLALTRGSRIRLGRWCAAGFLFAAATVLVEALAPFTIQTHLVSTMSFGFLMTALTLIAVGVARQFGCHASTKWFAGLCIGSIALNGLVVYGLPRGSWGQAIGYQGPFALVLVCALGIVLTVSQRRAVDLVLASVLGMSAVQFLIKIVLSGLSGHGPGVREYIVSPYAFYSQTAGGILSLLLGLSLIGLVVTEVSEETKDRLQHDGLSGLLTRAAFMERVRNLARKSSAPTPMTLILADLDRFKMINDSFGHAAGDEVIRAFGTNLRFHFGERALCGRLGGEEFCVFVPNGSPARALDDIEAIRSLTREIRHALLAPGVVVTASFGVALTDLNEPFEEALHRADMALYEVKQAGRNGYRWAASRGAPSSKDPFRLRSNAG